MGKKTFSAAVMTAVLMTAVFFMSSAALAETAEVADISNRAYAENVISQIDAARDEILVAMYSMYVRYGDDANPAMRLVDAIVRARTRGVDVRVYLDKSSTSGKDMKRLNKGNDDAYRILKEAGVDVRFIKPELKLHDKLIVIDAETVIDGSTNWTQKALTENEESAQIIRGKEFAATKRTQVLGLEKYAVEVVPEKRELLEKVRIRNSFLEDERLAPRMVTDSDGHVFDMYMLLLKMYKENGTARMTLDQADMAQKLGIKVETDSSKYRQEMLRLSTTLKEKYGLIDYVKDPGGDITVTLLDPETGQTYTTPEAGYFNVPLAYWEYGLDRQLILREKFFYLVNLYEQEIARPAPRWHKGLEALSKKYHIDECTLSNAVMGLRRLDIIDVLYSRPDTAGDYSDRSPSSYRVNELRSPEGRREMMAELASRYGEETVKSALECAAALDDGNDPAVIGDFCRLISQYGVELVRRAVAELDGYGAGNPLKNVGYVVGVIKRMIKEAK